MTTKNSYQMPLRMPRHLKEVFEKYAELCGKSMNSLFIDTLLNTALSDEKRLSKMTELDREVLNEKLRENTIQQVKYLRSRNASEAYEIPQIVLEWKKHLSKKYMSREILNINVDYTFMMVRQMRNAKYVFKELLHAAKALKEEYKWDYAEKKITIELKKLG